MKFTNLLAGAVLLASASFASAADINLSESLVFSNDDGLLNADFGHVFSSTDKGKTFLDEFTFTVTSSDLSATFSSPAVFKGTTAVSDLSFSSFSLYSSSGAKLATGDFNTFKGTDSGSLDSYLSAGTYRLEVAGTVLGSSGGKYIGAVTVSPVPEPETWGMTLSGLAAVGLMARRRKARGAKLS